MNRADYNRTVNIKHNRQLLSNFGVYSIPSWAPIILGFLLFPIYTAYLSPSDYGMRAIILLASLVIQILTNFGMSWLIKSKYYSFTSDEEKNEYISTLLIVSLLSRLTVCGIFFVFGPVIFPKIFDSWNGIMTYIFKIQLSIVMMDFAREIYAQVFIMDQKPKIYTIINLVAYVGNISVSLILLLGFNYKILSLFYGEFIASLTIATISTIYLRNKIVFKFKKKVIRDLIRIGLPSMPKNLFSLIQLNIDKYILQVFLPIGELGLYAKSLFVHKGFYSMAKAFSNAYTPAYLKELSTNQNSKLARNTMILWLYLTSIILLGLILYLPDIFLIMRINESFLICAIYAPILGLRMIIQGYTLIYLNNILFSQKTYFLTVHSVVVGLVNIICNILLIPKFGIVGAIFASILSAFTATALGFYISEKVLSYKSNIDFILFCLLSLTLLIVALLMYYNLITSFLAKTGLMIVMLFLLFLIDKISNYGAIKYHFSSSQ